MVWHHDEFMQEISALVAASEETLHNDLSYLGNLEQGPVLPGFSRHKIGARRSCSMSESSHLNFRG